jgi:hypothetical protein
MVDHRYFSGQGQDWILAGRQFETAVYLQESAAQTA